MTELEATIDVAILHELLTLDSERGLLFWKPRSTDWFEDKYNSKKQACAIWNKRFANKPAFRTMSTGYFVGAIFNNKHRAHRVIFAMANGHWPVNTVDHINGNRLDNRPSNLRDVVHAVNIRNQTLALPSSGTGVRGVHRVPSGKYVAQMRIDGKVVHLGTYETVEEAKAALELLKAATDCPVTSEHCSNGIRTEEF